VLGRKWAMAPSLGERVFHGVSLPGGRTSRRRSEANRSLGPFRRCRRCGRDEVFAQLVLARIIEPVSKLDSLRWFGRPGALYRMEDIILYVAIIPPNEPTGSVLLANLG